MKAIAYQQFGTTEVLQMLEQPKPAITSDQVLVKIKAFSINPMDWKIRKGEMKLMSGSRFPKNTGADFAGIIEKTGSSATGHSVGDKVFGVVKNLMKEGASAEYVAVPASLIWKKPEALSFAQAASLPVVGTAAVTAVEKMGKVNPESRILINGATGGFGMILLQLLKQRGAHITAVTSTKGAEYAKKWEAAEVIDYTKGHMLSQKNTYDIVVDLSGKMGYTTAKKMMKPKSIFINPTPQPVEIPLALLANLFTSKKHIVLLSNSESRYTEVLLDAVSKGLDIVINTVFPFTQFREAYQYAEQGGYVGKVVMEISDNA
ncbi:NADPH:quinone reductase [Chryseobacterium soldanellicola]|uniref:NADPH:quinone reductase n=1 Tax=Chryseobacterium soldanellicola TaxID=311333 RepID=A0A1H1FBK3_9FLAO|nr:NADP-dependent oxidoreductase [Chryseobacterium soldanellicola]SDQ98341.1 NADPH:quinone reductase [Chryseobacterium soldanellicola]